MRPPEDAVITDKGYACPHCNTLLSAYDEFTQEYMYCSKCMDYAYDVTEGENIGKLNEKDIDEEDR